MAIGDFTEDELIKNINMIVKGDFYKNNIKKLSEIFRDVKDSGVSNPAFWIEHVIKYGDRHLKSYAHQMPWYQFIMLDILAFLLSICIYLVMSVMALSCFLIRKCRAKKTKIE